MDEAARRNKATRQVSFQGGRGAMSSDPADPDDESEALRARLNQLKGELKGRAPPPRPSEPTPTPKSDASATGSAMSLGLRAGSEFVSAVILGLGIGWVLDRALHTNPAFLIVFFLIGVAAGIWNVIRLTSPKRSP
jgi:ATP synthase protein I